MKQLTIFFLMFVSILQAQKSNPYYTVYNDGRIELTPSFNRYFLGDDPLRNSFHEKERWLVEFLIQEQGGYFISSETPVKGTYSDLFFYFTPRFSRDLVILPSLPSGSRYTMNLMMLESFNSLRKKTIIIDGEKIISWWYILGLASIVLSFLILKLKSNKMIPTIIKISIFIFAILLPYFAIEKYWQVFPFSYEYVIFFSTIFASLSFMTYVQEKDFFTIVKNRKINIPHIIFNVIMIIFLYRCYLQV